MNFNYIGYVDAWYNIFYLQSYQHSWFIQFSRGCNAKFPVRFKKWWTFVGLLKSIIPPKIQEKFNFYTSKTSTQYITQPRLLTFYARLRILWILSWNFIKKQEQPLSFLLSLSREFNIKVGQIQSRVRVSTKDFTNNFKTSIIKFKRFDKFFTRLAQAEFLTLKNKCQASLATAIDLEQYQQGLIQTLK